MKNVEMSIAKSERERPARSGLRSVVLWRLSISTVLGHSLPPFAPLSKIRIIRGINGPL